MPSRPPSLLLSKWHKMLNLPRQACPAWHRDRLLEEQIELQQAKGTIARLSEFSDIIFAISRAHSNGYLFDRQLPPLRANWHVYSYMFSKFTLRWSFYRTAAWLCRAPNVDGVREVINPAKDYKLAEVAGRHAD
ncbi:hypothetical protein DL546_008301 [Coniochaeta pulveracea]|uniref:Uncharacterized protein n=1 Tax=Coniochaeta pulveracea TaxID=177199 RepID=A0A420YC60_9PEZI|nr:hypothetical protein DL546_008301 [Coniochaeta pulveracea]